MATVIRWERLVEFPVVNVLEEAQTEIRLRGDKVVPLTRKVWNPQIAWLLPDAVEDIVILDWKPFVNKVKRDLVGESIKARRERRKLPKGYFSSELEKRCLDRINKPVVFNGKEFHVFGWGSGAKDMQTLGMTRDFAREMGLLFYVEGYVRIAAAFVANGMYGGGEVTVRVKLVKDNTKVGSHVAADGASIWYSDVFDQLLAEREPISLSDGAQNFQIWQHFEMNEKFIEEVKAADEEMMYDMEHNTAEWAAVWADVGEFKRNLLAADPFMQHHPLYRAPISKNGAEVLYNSTTSVYVKGKIKIVVPSAIDAWCFPIPGDKFLLVRWPVDAPSNVQAIVVTRNELYEMELKRLSEMRVAQFRATSHEYNIKGVAQVVGRESGDFDVVMSVEDFKLVKNHPSVKEWRKSRGDGEIVEMTMFVSITQMFNSYSIASVPYERWKKMGGDWDGDLSFIMNVDKYPEIFRQAWEWRNHTNSFKVEKSETYDFSKKAEFLYLAWGNGVGFAVNVYAATFVEQPEDRIKVAKQLYAVTPKAFELVMKPGEKVKVRHMEFLFNRSVKLWTDIFKTMAIDAKADSKFLHTCQGVFSNNYGGTPSHILWRRSEYAFREAIPVLRTDLPEEFQKAAALSAEVRQTPQWRDNIDPRMMNSTIIQLFFMRRDWAVKQFAHLKQYDELEVANALMTAPLTDFVNWAPSVSEEELLLGKDIIEMYDAIVAGVDWRDAEDIIAKQEQYRGEVDKWVMEHFSGNRKHAAYALWRASHHSRNKLASASSVFWGMPEESLYIVRQKPGLINGFSVKVEDGQSIEDIAEIHGIDANDILAANLSIENSFQAGDYVRMPRVGYKCVVFNVHENLDKCPKKIGPLKVEVKYTEYKDGMRLAVFASNYLAGLLDESGLIGMIPRLDFKETLNGLSAPPVGSYIVTLSVLGGQGRYMGEFSPI